MERLLDGDYKPKADSETRIELIRNLRLKAAEANEKTIKERLDAERNFDYHIFIPYKVA